MDVGRQSVASALAISIAAMLAACGGGSGAKTATTAPYDSPSEITATTAASANGTTGATPTAFFDTDTTPPSATAAPTTASSGLPPHPACETPRPHAAGETIETMTSGGVERSYILHVPPQYDGTREMPLVLTLHGFGSNARQQIIYSQMGAKGDAEGFITVSPDGTGTPQHWNYPGLGGADDVAFIGSLLDKLESDLCIDPKWVFLTGMSNGAAFSSFIACAMPDRITAIAPVAATAYPLTCGASRAIPVISFRGTEDPCVPYSGGTSQCGQMLPVKPAEDAARQWAEHDGCNLTPAAQPYSEHVRTIAYSECDGDAAVVLFVVEGGGHTWPGSIDVPRLGPTTHEVNATDQIWEFFAAQGSLRR